MICVVCICRTDTELFVGVAVAEAGDGFRSVGLICDGFTYDGLTISGTTGDGGKVAEHPSYPKSALSEEYAELRKELNSVVLGDASFSTQNDPEVLTSDTPGTETMYGSIKGTGEPVCLTQVPFTSVFEVTE